MFSRKELEAAKQRFLEKCRGKLAVTPIETTNVEAIVDMFIGELEEKKKHRSEGKLKS